MTTRTIPGDQVNTAGGMAAFMKTLSPRTPLTGFDELRQTDKGVALAKKAKKPAAKKKAAKK